MAKSVKDLAAITQVILQAAKEPKSMKVEFQSDWQGIRLGFVDPPKWKLPDFLFDSDEAYLAQVVSIFISMRLRLTSCPFTSNNVWQKGAIEQAIDVIRSGGGTVHYPINPTHPFDIKFKGGSGFLKVLS